MAQSLMVRRGLERLRIALIISVAALVVLSIVLVLVMPKDATVSILLGTATGVLILGVTSFTTKKSLAADYPSLAWIALDYGAKIALAAGVLFFAKQSESLDLRLVAIGVVAGIVATLLAQAAAFVPGATAKNLEHVD